MRITLLTGMIVFVVSMTTMFISTYYAGDAINDAVLVTNQGFVEFLTNVGDGSELVQSREFATAADSTEAEAKDDGAAEPYYVDEQRVSLIKDNFRMIELLISLGASAVGMLLAYYLSSKSLKPLYDVSEKMLSVTQNNLNQKIEKYDTNDEIGKVIYAFNTMTERLDNQFSRQKRFSSNVAHELKTPLSVMKMSCEVLDEDSKLEEYRQSKEILAKQVDNLIRICDELLSYASVNQIEKTDMINFENIFSIVLEELDLLIREKGIRVVRDIDDTIAVLGNSRLVYMMLRNLLSNAIKYNVDGGSIYIVAAMENKNIVVTIADTGIGIDEENISNIFEPFYRENQSRSRKTGGSGLGLAFVKRIIDIHEWQISVESVKNKKTIFTITI